MTFRSLVIQRDHCATYTAPYCFCNFLKNSYFQLSFTTVDSKLNLPMSRFEPRTAEVGSNRSTN